MLTALLSVVVLGAPERLVLTPNLFTRVPQTGSAQWDATVRRDGAPTMRIVHTGQDDWAMDLGPAVPVLPGQALRLESNLRLNGAGRAALSYVMREGDRVVNWAAGAVYLTTKEGWQPNAARWLIAPGITSVQPRLEGSGPVELWLGPVTLTRRQVPVASGEALAPATLSNDALLVTFDPRTLLAEVTDRASGRAWRQRPSNLPWMPGAIQRSHRSITVIGVGPDGESRLSVEVSIPERGRELAWRIEGQGPLPEDLSVPGAWVSEASTEHVIPMNMGIGFRADDAAMEPQWLVGYGGHGLSMAWYGQVDSGAGVLNVIDDPDDFILRIDRPTGLLESQPTWRGQKGQFGYARRLRSIFLPRADVTALALRYRQEARAKGRLIPLADKAKANADVMRVARAANFWSWEGDKREMARLAYDAGFRNVLWSGGGTPEELKAIQALGFVTSRYDIYQDVMDPARFKDLSWVHPDWTTPMWPDHLVRDPDQDWVRGWVVQDKQGKDLPCAVACDTEVLDLARDRISAELRSHPYEARFIDTTTASEYRECYDPRHPMTRTQSKQARMQLLQLVTDLGLVTGSETGHEASVPHLVFYEGMMSLGPYRVPDAGTLPPKIYEQLPQNVLTFQLGPKYRLPLWQLVYGDCTVSTWYWGDFNNKHLGTWAIRDRWNQLYGTPPMYFTSPTQFRTHRAEFQRSYRETMRVIPLAAGQAMTAFRILTSDRTVQRTEWANGLQVTVNFGTSTWRDAGGEIAAGGVRVVPPKAEKRR